MTPTPGDREPDKEGWTPTDHDKAVASRLARDLARLPIKTFVPPISPVRPGEDWNDRIACGDAFPPDQPPGLISIPQAYPKLRRKPIALTIFILANALFWAALIFFHQHKGS